MVSAGSKMFCSVHGFHCVALFPYDYYTDERGNSVSYSSCMKINLQGKSLLTRNICLPLPGGIRVECGRGLLRSMRSRELSVAESHWLVGRLVG